MIANIHYFYFSSYFRPFFYFSLFLFCFFFLFKAYFERDFAFQKLDLRALLPKRVLKRRKGTGSARFAFLGMGFAQIVSKKRVKELDNTNVVESRHIKRGTLSC